MPFLRQPPAIFHLTAREETPPLGQTGQGLGLCPLSAHPYPHVCLLSVHCVPSTGLDVVQSREEQKEACLEALWGEMGTHSSLQGTEKKAVHCGGNPGAQHPGRVRAQAKNDVHLKGWSSRDVSKTILNSVNPFLAPTSSYLGGCGRWKLTPTALPSPLEASI